MNSYPTFFKRARQDFLRNRSLYLLVLPVIAFYIMFAYRPMYGAVIAFKNFKPAEGIWGSPWVGAANFTRFFNSPNFVRLIRNTLLLNLLGLLFSFPAPIVLALLLNEVRSKRYKSTIQTVTYMPHFISLIVVVGMVTDFTMSTGVVNDIIVFFGGSRTPLLQDSGFFRPIYIISEIWQEMGWGSIIYLAALSGIDEQLYEASMIDGASRFKRLIHVTLPGIAPTIIILLILRIGNMMTVGYEKIILMYNEATYETADVISSYVYRAGILQGGWSYSTAIGLFNSAINFTLLIGANALSRRFSDTSLW